MHSACELSSKFFHDPKSSKFTVECTGKSNISKNIGEKYWWFFGTKVDFLVKHAEFFFQKMANLL